MTNPVPDRPDEHDEPESEFIECPKCKGDGQYCPMDDGHYYPCPKCMGLGEILNPSLSDYEQACALYNRNRY